ncbi:hypothetical protein M4D56_02005 [Cytobacillus oceanisediminis]|uniref:hypothetical protein n=1 Tax=Cytobacillus oceanisediminis TaxID=665099 RepID=UPI0020420E93|nr:hypothetical protein [Cytobacillus oceanisediminis]MCM3527869.1 hypothetical protein [Cytobacillus oceanisediminis]
MDKLSEIKANLKRGRLPLRDIHWMVTEIENQRTINKEVKQKSRYKNYMDIAKENLALEEALKRTRSQRDYYKNQLNKLGV